MVLQLEVRLDVSVQVKFGTCTVGGSVVENLDKMNKLYIMSEGYFLLLLFLNIQQEVHCTNFNILLILISCF